MIKLAIFASGSGSNAENIINYFSTRNSVRIVKVFSNNKHAKVFDRCKRLLVPYSLFSKDDFYASESFIMQLKNDVDYIILAGFLWKVPANLINAFPNKIINIHPSLLPKYGGKGMFGMHVHNAVKKNNEIESGITIHFVNENYDEGAIIFQATIPISPTDSPEDIAHKIHLLEYEHFPTVIDSVIHE